MTSPETFLTASAIRSATPQPSEEKSTPEPAPISAPIAAPTPTASANGFFDQHKVPFSYSSDISIQQQGNDMGFFLQSLAGKPIKHQTEEVVKACFAAFSIAASHSLAKAALDIAKLIDTDAAYGDKEATYSGLSNRYHNARHFEEVTLSATFLLKIYESAPAILPFTLDEDDKAQLLFAALIHDLGHDGTESKVDSFTMENLSLELATPIVNKHLPKSKAKKFLPELAAMIYATNIAAYQGFMSDLLAFFHGEHPTPPPFKDIPPAFTPLLDNPRLAELAAMLCDADIAPSSFYNFSCCWEESVHLAEEMSGLSADKVTDDALERLVYFHENSARIKSLAARVFAPNFTAIRGSSRTLLIAKELRDEEPKKY